MPWIANGSPACPRPLSSTRQNPRQGDSTPARSSISSSSPCCFAALFVSGIGLLITGSHPVSPAFKAAHVVAAYTTVVLVAGHLYMALINPSTRPALRGMISGKVDATWVRKHHTRPGQAPSRLAADTRTSQAPTSSPTQGDKQ